MWNLINKIAVVVGLIGMVLGFMVANNLGNALVSAHTWGVVSEVIPFVVIGSFLLWVVTSFKNC